MRLTIGSRQSDLARIQSYKVGDALEKAIPGVEIVYHFRESLGDKNLTDPLWKMPEKGVFTEDFYQDLVSEKLDLVVHSWKDLPTEVRRDTEIVATLDRADARDLLLIKKSALSKRANEIRIFSSSPRRAYNLAPFLKEVLPLKLENIEFVNVRGNIQTRVRKLFETSDVDGLILAKAAMDRMLVAEKEEFFDTRDFLRTRLSDCRWMVLPLSVNPSAAAQGALAIEIKTSRQDVREVLKKIQNENVFRAVEEERNILRSFGGGCHQKIGVSVQALTFGNVLSLRGLTDQGQVLQEWKLENTKQMPKAKESQCFPRRGEKSVFFDRRTRAVDESLWFGKDLWVSREAAWIEGAEKKLLGSEAIWVSGLDTWKKLARLGVWVNGTNDRLGEELPQEIDILLGRKPNWVKLTHGRGYESGDKEVLATYELIPIDSKYDLHGKTHFFWMSGSNFLRAKELHPEIMTGFHACGPGNTYKIIREHVSEEKLFVYLTVEEWRKATFSDY